MTKALLQVGLFVLISTWSNAQTAKPKVFLGIDLFRSFPTYFQRGYTFEPSVIFHSSKGWIFDLAAGFTNIQHSKIYANMSYRNEGNYWRFAVRKEIGVNFDLGLGIGRSSFTEFDEVIFSDRVFGDYTLKLNQRNTLYFLEPSLSYKINLGPRFCLIPQYRMPTVL